MKTTLKFKCILAALIAWAIGLSTVAAQEAGKKTEMATFKFCYDEIRNSANGIDYADDLHITFHNQAEVVVPADGKIDGKWGSFSKAYKAVHHFPPPDANGKAQHYGEAGRIYDKQCIQIQFRGDTMPTIKEWYWTRDGKRINLRLAYPAPELISHIPQPGPSSPSKALVSVGGGISLPFNSPEGIYISHTQLHDNFARSITTQPEVFERLIEQFEGVFVLGEQLNPSQNVLPDATLRSSAQFIPGLQLGFSPTRNLEMSIGTHYFRSIFSDRFPITVYSFENSTPRIEYGAISAASQGILLDAGLKYLFAGKVRPYVEGGGRWLGVLQHEAQMEVAGLEFPFDDTKISSGFSGYAGAGARAYIGAQAYVQAGAMLAKWPGSDYTPGGQVSVGWTFGNIAKRGTQANLLLLNADDKEVDYDKITKRDELPKLIIPGYDRYTTERALNGLSHEKAMKKAFSSERAQKRWSEVFKRIYGK